MHAVWTIAKKELQSYFDSLFAYILLVLFLAVSGFFTWLYGNSDVFFIGQATLQPFFSISMWTLFVFCPAISMRLLAEEKKSGTIELLLTKATTDRQVILGKFLSVEMLVGFALLLTLPYVITLANIGNIDAGEVVCGYLGVMLLSGAYLAIGIYASSTTNNQIVAFLIALVIEFFFFIVFDMLGGGASGLLGQIFTTLSLNNHFESISRGILDTRDLIYFGSLIFLGLFLAELSLTKRNLN